MKSQPIECFFNYCPRCGVESPKAGSVPFRCGECGFANFFGPVAAVGALVVNSHSQILLVRRARDPGKGKWGLPGGFVDRGETIEQAMLREVMEETSLRITDFRYLMSHPNQYDYCGMVASVIDLFFCCQVASVDEVSLAPDELDYHEWVRPNDTHLNGMAFHSNRLAIELWLAQP